MPRGSSRGFRTKYSGAAAALGISGGVENRLVDSGFISRARGALKSQGFAVDGRDVSRIFQEDADLAQAELGLTAFDVQTVSVSIDSGEKIAHEGPIDLEIANAWTVLYWMNLDGPLTNMVPFDFRDPAGAGNRILANLTTQFTHSWLIQIRDAASATILEKQILNSDVVFGVWFLLALTWDGTDLEFYKDAVNDAGSINTDNRPGTMTSTPRAVFIGSQASIGAPAAPANGDYHWCALLDKALDQAAITEVYSAGSGAFNLLADSGNYDGAANVKHWWRLGLDSLDIGKDSGIAGTLIDVLNDAIGIDASDIVSNVPT